MPFIDSSGLIFPSSSKSSVSLSFASLSCNKSGNLILSIYLSLNTFNAGTFNPSFKKSNIAPPPVDMYIFPSSAGCPASTNTPAIFFDFFPASLNANPLSPPPITTTPSSSLSSKSATSSPNSTVLPINSPLSPSNGAKGPFQLNILALLIFSLYFSIVSGPNSANIISLSPSFIFPTLNIFSFLYLPFSSSHISADAPSFNSFTPI